MREQKSSVRRNLPSSTWLPLLLLVGLVLLFFNQLAFSNLILARGDTFLYFYPYWHAAGEALREGRIPLWNPDIFMGAPLLANSQAGFFYPLNWPLWLGLPTPYAVSASILLHLLIAAGGAYLAGRAALRLGRPAALVTAASFAFGGYLGAQAEHINQLQGLSWLPWFLWLVGRPTVEGGRAWLRTVVGIALLFALQLLAGHAQTGFITVVGLLIWFGAQRLERALRRAPEGRVSYRGLLALVTGGLLALALAAVQLLPTLELARLSSRQGGLPPNEVLSFSLHPLLLARSLLPAYGQSLFTEYVAFLPLTVLALAFIGGWQWRRREGVLPALAWVFLGLLLALGLFNPLYWLLARLPGFNFFRVPARWLALYALGMALLAGVGWQALSGLLRRVPETLENAGAKREVLWRPLLYFLGAAVLLAASGWLGSWLSPYLPTGPEAPFELPSFSTAAGWGVEALLLLLVGWMLVKAPSSWSYPALLVLGVLGLGALFFSSRALPVHSLTTPEAYFDLRPPATRLLAAASEPPARFLSLSDTFFDPGDLGEIESIYRDQLPSAALYDYTVAIKQKEIIAPNLSMIYGLPSVDGFDGGILPLHAYAATMRLLLPEGVDSGDGRLREYLESVPDARWLDLFNARYVITDKVGDVWHDGVFYDRQHAVRLDPGDGVAVGYVPPFEATELRVLASALPEQIQLVTVDGERWELEPTAGPSDGLYHLPLPRRAGLAEIRLAGCQEGNSCVVEALTLVDAGDNSFFSLVPGQYRRIHSGDVKIYENLDVWPRAFMVQAWQWEPDVEASVAAMQGPGFDGRRTAILTGAGRERETAVEAATAAGAQSVQIRQYEPNRVVLQLELEADGLLILTDAFYPGWEARIDGEPTPIYQANGLFRGVFVPSGSHQIVFTFGPSNYALGGVVTVLAVAGILVVLIATSPWWVSRRRR